MKIISYYTKDTPYEDVMNDNLLPSLKKWNLDYEIKAYADRGNWSNNTAIKSEFIEEMLIKHKQPVVFLDCDATIEKYPSLLYEIPKDVDLGFHHFNWFGFWRGQWENKTNIQLLSGTMYWAYNEKVLNLIDGWMLKIKENPHMWEQVTLQKIVYARNDLKIFDIPQEYCCVVRQDYTVPDFIKDPIIIHWQASRKYARGEWRRK